MPEPSRPLLSSHDCRRVSSASHLLGGREREREGERKGERGKEGERERKRGRERGREREREGGREREKEREGGRDIKVMQALPHAYKYLNMCNTNMYMHYTSYHALSC